MINPAKIIILLLFLCSCSFSKKNMVYIKNSTDANLNIQYLPFDGEYASGFDKSRRSNRKEHLLFLNPVGCKNCTVNIISDSIVLINIPSLDSIAVSKIYWNGFPCIWPVIGNIQIKDAFGVKYKNGIDFLKNVQYSNAHQSYIIKVDSTLIYDGNGLSSLNSYEYNKDSIRFYKIEKLLNDTFKVYENYGIQTRDTLHLGEQKDFCEYFHNQIRVRAENQYTK